MRNEAAITQTREHLALLLRSRPTPATERSIAQARRLLADLGGRQDVVEMAPEFRPALTQRDRLRDYHRRSTRGSRRAIAKVSPARMAGILQYKMPRGRTDFFGADLIDVSDILASIYLCGEGAGEGARRLTCYLRDNPEAPKAVWDLLAAMQDAHRAAAI